MPPPLIIANWYRQRKDRPNLEKWIGKSSREFSDDKNVQLEYARWLIEQRKLSKASIWLAKAEAGGANEVSTTFMKGQLAFIKGAFDVAEYHFSRIHTAQPSNVDASNLLALALVESGNKDKQKKALELATTNVSYASKNMAARSVLGYIQLRIGDVQRAAKTLEPVSRQSRLSPESTYFIARFLYDQGRKKNAQMFLNAIKDDQGIFLYRQQANRLKQKLQAELGASKETPGKSNSSNKKK